MTKMAAGSAEKASEIASKAAREVAAYRRFLRHHGISPREVEAGHTPFHSLPVMDKANYCLRHRWSEMVASSHLGALLTFARSAGTTGKPFYWPQLRDAVSLDPSRRNFYDLWESAPSSRAFQWERALRRLFGLHRYRTLAVVGNGLGSWMGGAGLFANLHGMALKRDSLSVVCIGNHPDELKEAVSTLHEPYERILLFLVPSLLERLLEELPRKVRFPFKKCRFAVGGENFDEDMREELNRRCGVSWPEVALAAPGYVSGDTGYIGSESLPSIALCRLLHMSQEVREALELQGAMPNLYHLDAPCYTEVVAGRFVFTLWSGMPLVRYDLKDRGQIWDWRVLRSRVACLRLPHALRPYQSLLANAALPDLLAHQGRADGLKLNGGLLHLADIEIAMRHPALARWSSGQFVMRVEKSKAQRIRFDIELKKGVPGVRASGGPTLGPGGLKALFYRTLINELCRLDAKFRADYHHTYKAWEEKDQPVFLICVLSWPTLSDRHARTPKRQIMAHAAIPVRTS